MLVHGRADQLGIRYARVWLYGDTGSGKTVAAASFPQPYFLLPHNEGSINSLRGMPCGFTTVVAEPDTVRRDILTFVEHLLGLAARSPQEIPRQFGQTLVLEAFTHLQDLIVSEVAAQKISDGDKRGQMSQPKWGLVLQYMLNIRDMLWQLPMHVVFTSLSWTKWSESGNVALKGGPAGQGRAIEMLPSSCDVLGYCDVGAQNQRVVHTEKYGVYPARSRFPIGKGPFPNHAFWQYLAPHLGYGP